MGDYKLYGLDEAKKVAWSEYLFLPNLEAAKKHALSRLEHFQTVEVWEGLVCVLRLRRQRDP